MPWPPESEELSESFQERLESARRRQKLIECRQRLNNMALTTQLDSADGEVPVRQEKILRKASLKPRAGNASRATRYPFEKTILSLVIYVRDRRQRQTSSLLSKCYACQADLVSNIICRYRRRVRDVRDKDTTTHSRRSEKFWRPASSSFRLERANQNTAGEARASAFRFRFLRAAVILLSQSWFLSTVFSASASF